jgi:hypothetical protein
VANGPEPSNNEMQRTKPGHEWSFAADLSVLRTTGEQSRGKREVRLTSPCSALVLTAVSAVAGACMSPRDRAAQKELLALAGKVRLCMTRGEVEAVLNQSQSPDIRRVRERGAWFALATPPRVGARNWMLLLDIHHDKLRSIKFRTEDSLDDHPDDAPPDAAVDPAVGCQGEA